MFNVFSSEFWTLIGFVLALIVLAFLARKFKDAKPVFIGIICVVVVMSGIYSGYQLHGYYSATGGIYGTIFGVESTIVKVDEMDFNFENMELLETQNNTHEAKVETKEVFGLNAEQSYEIKVNGEPAKLVTYGEEYAIAEYTYNFYDSTQKCVMNDTLTIRFSFFSNRTVLTVVTSGGDDAVKYWNSYFNNNTFIVSVKPVENIYSQDQELEMGEYEDTEENFVFATFYRGDEVYLKKVVKKGGELTLPTSNDLFWSLDGKTVITYQSIVIEEDTNFYVIAYDPDHPEDSVQGGNQGDGWNEGSGEDQGEIQRP